MSPAIKEMLDRVRRGDVPTTDEFAQEFAEIQEEIKSGAPTAPTVQVVQLDAATERAFLTLVLKRLEQTEMPKLIAAIETMRRQMGMESILFKRMGDYL